MKTGLIYEELELNFNNLGKNIFKIFEIPNLSQNVYEKY